MRYSELGSSGNADTGIQQNENSNTNVNFQQVNAASTVNIQGRVSIKTLIVHAPNENQCASWDAPRRLFHMSGS